MNLDSPYFNFVAFESQESPELTVGLGVCGKMRALVTAFMRANGSAAIKNSSKNLCL